MQLEQPITTEEIEFNLEMALEKISGDSFVFKYIPAFGINLYPRNNDNVPIGGSGVTMRSLDQILARFEDSLENEIEGSNSIIFFGNGLSLAPIELKRSAEEKRVTIVDMIDYQELVQTYYDNEELINRIAGSLKPSDREVFLNYFKNAILLLDAKERGEINIFRHSFGSEEIVDMGLYDLGINCFGPPSLTMPEQLLSIRPKGKIYYRGSLAGSDIITQSEI